MGAAADVLYSCRILSGMELNQMFLNQAPHRMGLVKKDFGPDPPTIRMASFLAKSMGGVSDSAQGYDRSRALVADHNVTTSHRFCTTPM